MIELHNKQIERKVLAGILQNEEVLEEIINTLTIEDFDIQEHKYLFDLISRFFRKYYKTLTHGILARYLTKNDPENKMQALTLFTELLATPLDKYLRYYVQELQELRKKRHLVSIYTRLQKGLENEEDPHELETSVMQEILQSSTDSSHVRRTTVYNDAESRIRLYQDKKMHPERYKGVPYGIKSIDELTGGMFSGHLYLVIGRTGAGKSRILFNIGCNAAKAGKKVMYCTIEMDAEVLQHMWESRELSLSLTEIMRTGLNEENEKKYFDFIKRQEQVKHPFYIVDIPQGCTTGIIEAEINTFKKIHGQVPDLVLIDYANLIQPISKYKDRAEKYDHVFREFKEAARANKTIYYTAAQQNRESLKASKVGTEHIAFSDAASYHCDAIFRISADEKDEVNSEARFDVVKGRYHGKQSITLHWNRDTNYIRHTDMNDAIRPLGDKSGVNDSNVSGSAQPQSEQFQQGFDPFQDSEDKEF